MTESDGAKLARLGTDATKWAAEFVRALGAQSDQRDALDATPGGLLHGWFCSAIETGRAAGAAEEARTGNYAAGMSAALGADWRDATAS